MKKFYLILSIYVLSCLMACGKPTSNTDEFHSQSSSTESEYNTQQVNIPKSTILDNRIKADEQGILWNIPNAYIEQGLQQTMLAFGENLLVYGNGLDENDRAVLKIAILSMQNGKVLHQVDLSDIEVPIVQVLEDTVVVSDWLGEEVLFFNSELRNIKTYHTNLTNSGKYVNPLGDKVYCVTAKDGIHIMDIKDNKTTFLLENTANLFVSSVRNEFVFISYTDLETQLDMNGVINLVNGTVEMIPFSGAFYDAEFQGDIWKAAIAGERNAYIIGTAEKFSKFIPNEENGIVSMLHNPDRLLVTSYGKDGSFKMSLYEMEGKFLSEVVLPMEGYSPFYEMIWSEEHGGYFFASTDISGKDRLLFWDLSTSISGEPLHMEEQTADTHEKGTVVSEKFYEKAEELSLKYGIEVKIAELTETEFADFTVQQELNETYISSGLDILEKVCASYPKGFMEQLFYGSQKEIEVHLVGMLTKHPIKETNSGFTVFDAFVEEQAGKTVLVADITRTHILEQTLYHEIAHLIDHKLTFDASVREDAIYSEEVWQKLNPNGFVYAESYHNIPMELYDVKYDAYFIDVYSRTFSKEDKARIMEYAMMKLDWAFSDSSKKLAKLEYWSKCIRDAFDTTGWPKQTVWEQMLERCKE